MFEIENGSARFAAVDFQREIQLESAGNRSGIWRGQLVFVRANVLLGHRLPDSEAQHNEVTYLILFEVKCLGEKYDRQKYEKMKIFIEGRFFRFIF